MQLISTPENTRVSNPIKKSGLIAKINALNGKAPVSKSNSTYTEKPLQAVNYPEFIRQFNEIIARSKNIHDLFSACHQLFTNKLNSTYTSLGIINKTSNCINIQLADKIGSIFSSRVFLSEDSNEIVKTINSKTYSINKCIQWSMFIFIIFNIV